MRILAIGDPHFRATNALQTAAFTEEVAKIVSDIDDIDAVVVLGDILDRHDRVDLFPLHRAIHFLSEIRKALSSHPSGGEAKQLVVLIGNHDRPNNTTFLTDEHAFTSLKQWPNTIVVDEPKTLTVKKSVFMCVPYVPTGRFIEALEIKSKEWSRDVKAVFAHQEFRGCKLGATVSRQGDEYPLNAPLCISGHIHEYSSPQKNIIYPGAPYSLGWVDRETSDHALMLFSFGNASSVKSERIRLTRVPHNITLQFKSPRDLTDKIEEACAKGGDVSRELSKLASSVAVSNIRVKVQCETRDEYNILVSNGRAMLALQKAGIQVVPTIVNRSASIQAAEAASTRFRRGPSVKPFIVSIVEELEEKKDDVLLIEFLKSALPHVTKI